MAANPRLDQIVADALKHANEAGDMTASFGLVLTDRIFQTINIAGDLLDALRDELRHEVGESPVVLEHVLALTRLIGGEYANDYLEGWY